MSEFEVWTMDLHFLNRKGLTGGGLTPRPWKCGEFGCCRTGCLVGKWSVKVQIINVFLLFCFSWSRNPGVGTANAQYTQGGILQGHLDPLGPALLPNSFWFAIFFFFNCLHIVHFSLGQKWCTVSVCCVPSTLQPCVFSRWCHQISFFRLRTVVKWVNRASHKSDIFCRLRGVQSLDRLIQVGNLYPNLIIWVTWFCQ